MSQKPVKRVESNGTVSWWLHGFLHNMDGPAKIYSDGRCKFYINGYPYLDLNDYIAASNWTNEDLVIWKLSGQTSFYFKWED